MKFRALLRLPIAMLRVPAVGATSDAVHAIGAEYLDNPTQQRCSGCLILISIVDSYPVAAEAPEFISCKQYGRLYGDDMQRPG